MTLLALFELIKKAGFIWNIVYPWVKEYAGDHNMTVEEVLQELRDLAVDTVDESAAFHLEFWAERVEQYKAQPVKTAAQNLLTITGMDPAYYAAWWKRRLARKNAPPQS